MLFAIFSGVAILLAGLGLMVSSSPRRPDSPRSSVSARQWMRALSRRQLCRPVLWTNLAAWPLAWWGLNRWLLRYAYYVAMELGLLPAAGAAALAIAFLTIGRQTFAIARRKAGVALWYEESMDVERVKGIEPSS